MCVSCSCDVMSASSAHMRFISIWPLFRHTKNILTYAVWNAVFNISQELCAMRRISHRFDLFRTWEMTAFIHLVFFTLDFNRYIINIFTHKFIKTQKRVPYCTCLVKNPICGLVIIVFFHVIASYLWQIISWSKCIYVNLNLICHLKLNGNSILLSVKNMCLIWWLCVGNVVLLYNDSMVYGYNWLN